MARNFADADFYINVGMKVLGGKHSDGKVQGYIISDSDWTSTVLPAINGTFHVDGVDELKTLHYWKENNPVGESVWYLAENQDMTGEIPVTTNDSSKIESATTLYNTLLPLRTQYRDAYDDEQTAAVNAAAAARYFIDNDIPETLVSLRGDRDRRLASCDWTVLPDTAVTTEKLAHWKTYRQRLRDLPAQQADPYDYNNFTGWPVTPNNPSFVP